MAKQILAVGEILWDLLPDRRHLGGAPLNFIYRVDCLGAGGRMISRLGSDDLGREALERMKALGMDTSLVQWDAEHPTGTVPVTFDDAGQPDYEIIADVAYDYMEPTDEALAAARSARCICFGTLAQRQRISRTTCQRLLAEAQDAVKLLDINLRRDCYDRQSVVASMDAADILKLNDQEVADLAELLELQSESMIDRVRELIDRHQPRLVVVTCGANGAVAVSPDDAVYEPGFVVELVDPIGSGDAFTAGFAHRYLDGAPPAECCRYGNAVGALVAGQSGATQPLTADDVEAFLDSDHPRSVDEDLASEAG